MELNYSSQLFVIDIVSTLRVEFFQVFRSHNSFAQFFHFLQIPPLVKVRCQAVPPPHQWKLSSSH